MARVKKETKKSVTVEKTAKKAVKAVNLPAGEKKVAKTVKVAKVKVLAESAARENVSEKPKADRKIKTGPKEDTGSVDFQINNFSQKIKLLAKHLKTHTHDFDSRRGLLIMVGKRRRLLNYLKKSDLVKYEEMAKTLKLKA